VPNFRRPLRPDLPCPVILPPDQQLFASYGGDLALNPKRISQPDRQLSER